MHAVTVGPLDEREQRAGVASGLFNTTQVMGGALGLAVLSTLASGRTEDLLRAGDSATPALNGGYQLAFFTASAVATAALAPAAGLLRTPRRAAIREAPASAPPVAPATAPATAQPDRA
ncbi:hypothetical protein [Streptomyces sp. V1I1]|uniref:hypothetical protein n=1 Tax=Streptomyces sp. V1I1 TaxID=3042272 RepID=UPI00277E3C45|nr:hypothetical protein [Streptomyces sp. V1I1]MDQ0939871.1 hypothetical protein [Streptomyces sp. V1I1]